MVFTIGPFLATSIRTISRSVLLFLGIDHTLLEFLALVAVGAATVILAMLTVGVRAGHRSVPKIRSPRSVPKIRRTPR